MMIRRHIDMDRCSLWRELSVLFQMMTGFVKESLGFSVAKDTLDLFLFAVLILNENGFPGWHSLLVHSKFTHMPW